MQKKELTQDTLGLLLDKFYEQVRLDKTIGYIFNDVANLNWEEHVPKIHRFWLSVLFGEMAYKGNPMLAHIQLNRKENLHRFHFDRWIEMWEETIDEYFIGEKAYLAKQKASSIKEMMLYKIGNSQFNITSKS